MKIEEIMDKWEEYLRDRTLQLVMSVEEEEYEISYIVKSDIDKRASELSKFLIENKLTTLDYQSVYEQINKRVYTHMNEWYDILEIEENKRALFS